jgi:hypothetical protein
VNHVNIVMCDSTPTTTTMPPKKQPQHDQPRSGPPKPDKKGKGRRTHQVRSLAALNPRKKAATTRTHKVQLLAAHSRREGHQEPPLTHPVSGRQSLHLPRKRLLPKRGKSERRPKRHMRHITQTSSLTTLSEMPQSTKLSSCSGCRPGRVWMTWLPHQASAPVPAYHGHHTV